MLNPQIALTPASWRKIIRISQRHTRAIGFFTALSSVAYGAESVESSQRAYRLAAAIQNVAPGLWSPSVGMWAIGCGLLTLFGWKLRDRIHHRHQAQIRIAIQRRTEQLQQGQEVEASRNRILEMLVSNEPLNTVLRAIAQSICDQVPGIACMILVKNANGVKHGNEFFIGAAPGVTEAWLAGIGRAGVPFETWRGRCEYLEPQSEPAWDSFFEHMKDIGGNAAGPSTIRSVPIGESGVSLGAIVLLYPEPGGVDHWERVLCLSARLAQIAIEHRRFYEQLDHQAHHDSLTGLPNRACLDDSLEAAIVDARSKEQRLALLYIDVDEFKEINDRYSHRAGDALLVELGRRMQAELRQTDTLARIGGDEFNVILPDIGNQAAAIELAERVLATVNKPVSVNNCNLTVTLSIGIAMFPDDGEEGAELQRQADAAMYCAKSLGKNRAQSFADNRLSLDSVRMEQNLKHALLEGWFTMYYQPKFTAHGELAGMEALIRMNHPRHGQIPPGQFISIAETTGLIVPIGAWVVDAVCRQLADWRARNLAPVVVAVNVSALQMARPDFAEAVEACLAAHSVPAHCLELEVTESMLVHADSGEHRQMQRLRGLGVCISIDDFGTGFSSLSYLNRLSVDTVKLDRSFVQTIDVDPGAQKLVRAIIGVAQGLGLDVVAEGVETEAQRSKLIAAGCPVMQGYLFAHPGPPETVEALLSPDFVPTNPPGDDLSRLYGAIQAVSQSATKSLCT